MDTPRKVLIVDDERDMLSNCTRILRRCGYECLSAETSEQGLAQVHQHQSGCTVCTSASPCSLVSADRHS